MSAIIDHLNHPLALEIRSLLERNQRLTLQKIIIDDEENILQALAGGVQLERVVTTDVEGLPASLQQSLPEGVSITELSKRTGKKLFGGEKMSRLFAIAKLPKPLTLDDVSGFNKDYMVLDHLTIAGNIGAIIRTSMAFSTGAIILLGSEPVDIYDRRIIRASRGFVFRLPMVAASTTELITHCQTHQRQLLLTTANAKATVDSIVHFKEPLAIVFGSEKTGCSAELAHAADLQVKIPLNPAVESLNVSVAASIMLYLRQLA